MAKDRIPPAPRPRYEGIRWLGSQWGTSGDPRPAKIGAWFGVFVTVLVWFLAARAFAASGGSAWVFGNLIVGAICAVASAFYFAEAHFAARVAAEQSPLTD